PAPAPPPPPLIVTDDWDPGDDPRMRLYEEARERLVERLITAGSAQALESLGSIEELRILASFLWLPRESAPLRRLGLRIQAVGAGMSRRALLHGPDFEVEMDNYRFSATTNTRQAAAERRRAETAQAAAAMARLSAIAAGDEEPALTQIVGVMAPAEAVAAATHPLEDEAPDAAYITRELEAIAPAEARPARQPTHPPEEPLAQPERGPNTGGGRRLWPLPGLLRRPSGDSRRVRE
ncbi:MAG: hypothetical protein ACRDID_15370, partial [Ktedonobacterales bacterium]